MPSWFHPALRSHPRDCAGHTKTSLAVATNKMTYSLSVTILILTFLTILILFIIIHRVAFAFSALLSQYYPERQLGQMR